MIPNGVVFLCIFFRSVNMGLEWYLWMARDGGGHGTAWKGKVQHSRDMELEYGDSMAWMHSYGKRTCY